MKAIILAGGKGTRLQSVISDIPKPMAPVGSKPFLEYLVLQLKYWDIKDIVISIGYKGEVIKSYFGDGKKWGVTIEYSEEYTPMGTGGAVREALKYIHNDNTVVLNGDSFFSADFKELISSHGTNDRFATIALVHLKNMDRYGMVSFNDKNEIVSFSEKRGEGAGFINAGIYVLNKKIAAYLPDGPVSLERDVFPKLIWKGLSGIVQEGFFIDIGIPEDYRYIASNPSLISVHHER
ncbi:MAG: nucleotidyltransferase family protein [Thermodesulfovibrionales bacterium]